MRYLRWVGFISSLLFVGVLVAPTPSEAAPTLRLSWNGGINYSNVTLGAPSTCIPAEDQFTTCYNIPLGSYCPDSIILLSNQLESADAAPHKVLASWSMNKGLVPDSPKSNPARLVASGQSCVGNASEWIIGNYSATTTTTTDDSVVARLIVTDNGGTGLDRLRISGVTFKPGPSNSGTKTLRVEYANAFNGRGNTGRYIMGLLIGGNYNAGTPANNRLNTISYSGIGVFCSPTTTDCPDASNPIGSTLSSSVPSTSSLRTVGIGVNGTASLQSPTGVPLPSFTCNSGEGDCRPTITQTIDFSVTNFDQVALAGSGHTYGCLKLAGESDIETFSATTTTLTCRQLIRQEMRRDARREAKALKLVSGRHFTCPVCKEGHEDEECDDHDSDPD